MINFNYYIPTQMLFGPGKLNELATIALPGKKAMIVITGGTSMKKYGYIDRVIRLLKENQNTEAVVFDKILPNPVRNHVMEAAEICRKEKCDFIIGLGGGSSIDSAKSIAIMVNNSGDYWDYIQGGSGLGKPVKQKVLPIVAITTTAGTGTEMDPWTVITHETKNEKIGFGLPTTFPVFSIVDPELMLSIPPHLTAFQGFDAFFHAAEGYIANIATPISDIYALKSIELIYKNLATAVNNGTDIEARTNVALANSLAGMVESTSSCTSEHSMEHAMSAYYPQLPHGAGLIMISLAYFKTFADKIPQRFIDMAECMGVDMSKLSKSEKPYAFVKALEELQKTCGMADLKMSSFGIKKEDFAKFAKNARATMGGLLQMDRYLLSDAEIVRIFEESYR